MMNKIFHHVKCQITMLLQKGATRLSANFIKDSVIEGAQLTTIN
jgi:hypothetical protein